MATNQFGDTTWDANSSSKAFENSGSGLVGLILPVGFAGDRIAVSARKEKGATTYPVIDPSTGQQLVLLFPSGAPAGAYIVIPPQALLGATHFTLTSMTGTSPTIQTAAQTISIIYRAFS